MLDRDSYINELSGLPLDTTVAVKHRHCPASGGKADHKARLRLTRVDNKTVLYYCHHCGERGAIHHRIRRGDNGPPVSSCEPVEHVLPRDLTLSWNMFPKEAINWLESGGLTAATGFSHGIGWSEYRKRLILPCRGHSGALLGYQSRAFRSLVPEGDRYIKYLTKRYGDILYHWEPGSGDVVLVEDCLSAYRLGEAGYTGVALLGTALSKPLLLQLMAFHPDSITIWLDNDNTTVRQNSRKIRHTLDSYAVADSVRVLSNASDPKHYTNEDIKALLGEG